MSSKKNVELWVGIFLFVGLTTLAYMIIRLGSYDPLTAGGYELVVSYKFTNGVIEGAPVRVAGVEAGRVKKLILTPDKETKVDVVVAIEKSVQLRRNVVVMINSLGIMGEKYVEFLPQDTDAEVLKPGDRIIGEEPTSIADLTRKAGDFAGSLESVFKDGEKGSKLSQIMDNMIQMTGEKNRENFSGTLVNLNEFSGKMNTFGTDMETLSREKAFSETVRNFHQASQSLNEVLAQIKSGKGTVGKLLYDTEVHDSLKALIQDLMKNPSKLFRPSPDKEKGKGSFFFPKKDK